MRRFASNSRAGSALGAACVIALAIGAGCWVRSNIACDSTSDCPAGSSCVMTSGASSGLCTATDLVDMALPPDLFGIDQANPECMPGAVAMTNADCQPDEPVCGFDGRCRGCERNAECESDICLANGRCGALAQTAIVDRAATCTGADGSPGKPYCEISDAITNLQGRTVLRVRAAAAAYGPFAVTTPLEIVGPDAGGALDAVVQGGITSTDVAGTVALTGVRLAGTSAGKANLTCAATGSATTLVLRRIVVVDGAGFGVDVAGCALEATQLRVMSNRAGGVRATGAAVKLESSILATNLGPGIELDTTAAVVLRGLTIADNQAPSASGRAGGVHSLGAKPTLAGSIVWNNSLLGGSPLANVGGENLVANVAIEGANTSPPDFVSSTDFHLDGRTVNNNTCCIDKIDSGPPLDVDGQPRPLGAKVDIGADEVP